MSRASRVGIVLALLVVVSAAIPPVRRAGLASVGRSLMVTDRVEPGDIVVISESGDPVELQAAMLEAADLYHRGLFPRVMLVRAAGEAVDAEMARRGVKLNNPVIETLRQLGVPPDRIATIDAGEGSTTDSTKALAGWVRAHPSRVLVVIGAPHSRRYRRALLRVWPPEAPPPQITYPERTLFRPQGWWMLRRTLREGLFEFQKLVWDYATHPF
jgi:hypothetical protein